MLSFEQDEDGVTATLFDHTTQTQRHVRAKYMVACDGFRSPTRSQLGIPLHGPGLLSRALTIYFEVLDKQKLASLPNGQLSGIIYVSNPTLRSFFRFDLEKKESFLVINAAGPEGTEESRLPADTATMEKAEEYLRAAIGDNSIEFRLQQLSTWEAIADVPKHLQVDCILLAGDAAHRMPPSGGFGGNTGCHDAHNLAWKLAMVLKGQADPKLLRTYESERHPVAEFTVRNAVAHYVERTEPSLSHFLEDFAIVEVPIEHLELGYIYHSIGSTHQKDDRQSEMTADPATAIARPGSMAYHIIVTTKDGSAREVPISNFLSKSLVLFTGSSDNTWNAGLNDVLESDDTLPDVDIVNLDTEKSSSFTSRYGVQSDGAVLIRPDGFVAWSSAHAPLTRDIARIVLSETLGRILCRDVAWRATADSRNGKA